VIAAIAYPWPVMLRDPHIRVSDADRDEAVELLREHLVAGRLDPDEHEERVGQACGAKFGRDLERALRELPSPRPSVSPAGPPVFVRPTQDGRPGASLTFGLIAVCILFFTFGAGAFFALPLSVAAWVIGARAASRPAEGDRPTGRGRGTARTGMWLGVAGTLLSLLALGALAAMVLLMLSVG